MSTLQKKQPKQRTVIKGQRRSRTSKRHGQSESQKESAAKKKTTIHESSSTAIKEQARPKAVPENREPRENETIRALFVIARQAATRDNELFGDSTDGGTFFPRALLPRSLRRSLIFLSVVPGPYYVLF